MIKRQGENLCIMKTRTCQLPLKETVCSKIILQMLRLLKNLKLAQLYYITEGQKETNVYE